MSISTEAARVVYEGNGVATEFPFDFPIRDATHLNVVMSVGGAETPLNSALYSVTGISPTSTGGTVTYPLVGTPLPAGWHLTIYRDATYAQTTVLSNQGAYSPVVAERTYDYGVMLSQQLRDMLSRSMVGPVSDDEVQGELPRVSERKNKFLYFDDDGHPSAVSGTPFDPTFDWVRMGSLNLLDFFEEGDVYVNDPFVRAELKLYELGLRDLFVPSNHTYLLDPTRPEIQIVLDDMRIWSDGDPVFYSTAALQGAFQVVYAHRVKTERFQVVLDPTIVRVDPGGSYAGGKYNGRRSAIGTYDSDDFSLDRVSARNFCGVWIGAGYHASAAFTAWKALSPALRIVTPIDLTNVIDLVGSPELARSLVRAGGHTRVERIRGEHCDFTVLCNSIERLTLYDVEGRDTTVTQAHPHTIYVGGNLTYNVLVDDPDNPGGPQIPADPSLPLNALRKDGTNGTVKVTRLRDYDNPYANSFKFRICESLFISDVHSENAGGGLSLINNDEAKVEGVKIVDVHEGLLPADMDDPDDDEDTTGGFGLRVNGCRDSKISDVDISIRPPTGATQTVYGIYVVDVGRGNQRRNTDTGELFYGRNNHFKDVIVRTNYSGADRDRDFDPTSFDPESVTVFPIVRVGRDGNLGERMIFENIEHVDAWGHYPSSAPMFSLQYGADHKIINPRRKGATSNLVTIGANSSGNVIQIDPALVDSDYTISDGGAPRSLVLDPSTSFVARPDDPTLDSGPLIRSALDRVVALGMTALVLPAGAYYIKTGEVVLETDGLQLVCRDGIATIVQETWGYAGVILDADDCLVRNIRCEATAPTQAITGITQDNPGVVTYAGSDYTNGFLVYIEAVAGMTELNGRYFKVANTDTFSNTFELQDADGLNVDTTGYGAYTSGGTVTGKTRISTSIPNRWRGEFARNRSSGFLVAGERCKLENVSDTGFVAGVRFLGGTTRIWAAAANGGTATTTTLQLNTPEQQADDYYNGMLYQLFGTSGGSMATVKAVLDYDSATNTITFADIGSLPTGTIYYKILSGKSADNKISHHHTDHVDFGIGSSYLADVVLDGLLWSSNVERSQNAQPHGIYFAGTLDAADDEVSDPPSLDVPSCERITVTGQLFCTDSPDVMAWKFRTFTEFSCDGAKAIGTRGGLRLETGIYASVKDVKVFQADTPGVNNPLAAFEYSDVARVDLDGAYLEVSPDFVEAAVGARPRVVTVSSVGNNRPPLDINLRNISADFDGTASIQHGLLAEAAISSHDIASGAYTSGTGVLILTMASVGTFTVAATVVLQGLDGTGAYASLAGTWPITATATVGSATTVTVLATSGLGAAAITDGVLIRTNPPYVNIKLDGLDLRSRNGTAITVARLYDTTLAEIGPDIRTVGGSALLTFDTGCVAATVDYDSRQTGGAITFTDTARITSAATAGNRVRNRATEGSRNLLLNSGFDDWAAGTSFALATNTVTTIADNWKGLRATNNSTISRQTGFLGATYAVRSQRNVGTGSTVEINVMQQISTKTTKTLVESGQVTLIFAARCGADYSAATSILRTSLWTGTGVDETIGSAGFPTGQAATTNQTVKVDTTERWFAVRHTLAAGVTEMAVRFHWNPVGTAGAADYVEVTQAYLVAGATARPVAAFV